MTASWAGEGRDDVSGGSYVVRPLAEVRTQRKCQQSQAVRAAAGGKEPGVGKSSANVFPGRGAAQCSPFTGRGDGQAWGQRRAARHTAAGRPGHHARPAIATTTEAAAPRQGPGEGGAPETTDRGKPPPLSPEPALCLHSMTSLARALGREGALRQQTSGGTVLQGKPCSKPPSGLMRIPPKV